MSLSPPSVPTFIVGGALTAAWLNTNVRDAITFLSKPPLADVYQATGQTFTTGVWAACTFDASNYDTYSGHSNTTNNSRYTAQVAGYYELSGVIGFVSNTTGVRYAEWAVNGTRIAKTTGGGAALTGGFDTPAVPKTTIRFLNVNDYVELHGFQNSGGNLNGQTSGDVGSSMSVRWVSS